MQIASGAREWTMLATMSNAIYWHIWPVCYVLFQKRTSVQRDISVNFSNLIQYSNNSCSKWEIDIRLLLHEWEIDIYSRATELYWNKSKLPWKLKWLSYQKIWNHEYNLIAGLREDFNCLTLIVTPNDAAFPITYDDIAFQSDIYHPIYINL